MSLRPDGLARGFFLKNQEKGPLFTGIDCRDHGSLEQQGWGDGGVGGILITTQEWNLPEGWHTEEQRAQR